MTVEKPARLRRHLPRYTGRPRRIIRCRAGGDWEGSGHDSAVATAAWTSSGTRGCVAMRSVQMGHIDHPLLPRYPRTTVHHTEPRTLLIPKPPTHYPVCRCATHAFAPHFSILPPPTRGDLRFTELGRLHRGKDSPTIAPFVERREHGQDGAASRLNVAGEERKNLHCIRDLTVGYFRSEDFSDHPWGRIPSRFERGNADSQDGTGEPVDFP